MKQLLKKVYRNLPFKKQVFRLMRHLPVPSSIYQHLYFQGVFKVNVGKGFRIMHYGNSLENELFWGGTKRWEPLSLDLWTRLAGQSKTILDIGANSGVYSLMAGASNASATIYSFEALPNNFKRLKKNIELNPYQIKPFDMAVSNQNGTISFYTDNLDFSYAASINKNHQSYSNTLEIKVNCITLDQFISDHHLIPNLVKIDVERHEPEVFEGFMRSLEKYQPTLLVEVLDADIASALRKLLKDSSYEYYSINDKTRTIKKMKQLEKSEDFNILICNESIARSLNLS